MIPVEDVNHVRPQRESLSFMAGLAVIAKQMRAAEGYLLELLADAAFNTNREGTVRA